MRFILTAIGLTILAVAIFIWSVFASVPAYAGEVCGEASFYGVGHHGRTMANGRPFNMHALTAAMWGPKFGTRYIVRNVQNGKTVQIVITDRGPAKRLNRLIDLSHAAFARIAPTAQGVIKTVCLTKL